MYVKTLTRRLGTDAPSPDPNSSQVPLSSVSVATGVTMVLALLLTVLFYYCSVWVAPQADSRVPDLKIAPQGDDECNRDISTVDHGYTRFPLYGEWHASFPQSEWKSSRGRSR